MAPKREIFAWAMFDFANSSYTTVVTTTIFNQYFVHDICKGLSIADATFRLTLSLAIANGLVVVTAPLVGALADAIGKKKFLLFIATSICVLTTAGLAFIQPGGVIMAMVLFILSGFGFGTSEYLIAAFLPELAPKDRMGKVSSLGWTLGYIGGLVILGLCLAYVSWAQKQGQASTQFVPVTLLFVAVNFCCCLYSDIYLAQRESPGTVIDYRCQSASSPI
jgi:UMF1 family MFS transporter